jgi:chromosome segregation ATPase
MATSFSVDEYNRRYNQYWADRKITAPPVYPHHVNHLMSDYIEQTLRADGLEANLNSVLAEVDRERKSSEELKQEKEAKRLQILDLRGILQSEMNEKNAMIKQLQNVAKQRDQLEQKVDDLDRKLEQQQQALKQRTIEINNLKDEVKRLITKKGDVLDLKMQLSQRTAEKDASISKILEMHDQMSGVMNKWQSAEQERKALENRVGKLEKEQDQPLLMRWLPWNLKSSDNLMHLEPVPTV